MDELQDLLATQAELHARDVERRLLRRAPGGRPKLEGLAVPATDLHHASAPGFLEELSKILPGFRVGVDLHDGTSMTSTSMVFAAATIPVSIERSGVPSALAHAST